LVEIAHAQKPVFAGGGKMRVTSKRKLSYYRLGWEAGITDYYLCRLATPWKLKITAPQAATTALLIAGVALWHAPGGSF